MGLKRFHMEVVRAMAYHVRLSPTAAANVRKLAKPLRKHVRDHLRDLAASPTTHSKPAVFPFPPRSQISHAPDLIDDEGTHHFVVLFRYGQDEETLEVIGVGH